jgi:hypothetical protein
MQLLDILTRYTIDNPLRLVDYHKVLFVRSNKEYTPIFMRIMHEWLYTQDNNITSLSIAQDNDEQQIQSQLTTTFLGQHKNYWLGDIDQLEPTKKKKWQQYLIAYQGPHTLLYASMQNVKSSDKTLVILLPSVVDRMQFDQLQKLFEPRTQKILSYLKHEIFMSTDALPLDKLCILGHYASLLGNNHQEFVGEWLSLLVPQEVSLFALSQYFFAGKRHAFYTLWKKMQVKYSLPFWLAFWSEHVWRAHYFCAAMSQNRHDDAQQIAARRLPFSFMKYDWKKYKTHQLQESHEYLYSIDYLMKNGGNHDLLESFFASFFARKFNASSLY